MIIYIGADHNGFYLKETLKTALKKDGYEVIDLGDSKIDDGDDYPEFASAVAEKVAGTGQEVRGIVVCGSGIGVDIVANKFGGIRSALAISADQIRAGRRDDDVNVLALAAGFIQPGDALDIARAFLSTPFGKEERYSRRLGQISDLEKNK
jgi:ribose 5-phosphate isomerase B